MSLIINPPLIFNLIFLAFFILILIIFIFLLDHFLHKRFIRLLFSFTRVFCTSEN